MDQQIATLDQTLVQLLQHNTVATAARLYLAVAEAEKRGIDLGLTRQSLTNTKDNKQSHADAAKGLIVSTTAAENGAVLSDIGKAVTALPMFAQVFPQDKWAKAQVKLVADKGQQVISSK